jgi:predicted DNA-binding protein (MmcQ/YjbR family)
MRDALAFALSLPEAWEDHPWGDTVVKVRKKIFAFVGAETLTVKLDEAHGHALSIDGAEPTGYGLGKAGWVTVPVDGLPDEIVRDWVEESYRLVAPKKLIAQLDSGERAGEHAAELDGAGRDDARAADEVERG